MKWTVLLASALLAACASQLKLEAPNLNIVGIEMLQSDLFTQRMKVRIRVQNPNDTELPIKGVSANLEIGGEKFASGVSAAPFTVPAFGESEFDLMVDASMAATLFRIAGKAKKNQPMQSLDYRLSGKVSLSSGMFRTIPFDESGSFDFQQAR